MSERINKGKGDVVFLLDVTGSMEKCIQAVKDNLITFASTLATEVEKLGTANEKIEPDIRYKVVGYRDQPTHSDNFKWYVDFPFVRTTEDLKKQIDHPDMAHKGGADEPESLLEALYKLGMAPESGNQETEDPNKWRYQVAKTVAIFTDASFHEKATLPEIKDLDANGIYEKIASAKLRLFGLVPEWKGYDLLGAFPYSTMEYYIKGDLVKKLGEDSPEGAAAQIASVEALENLAKNKSVFTKIVEDIAKGATKHIKPELVD